MKRVLTATFALSLAVLSVVGCKVSSDKMFIGIAMPAEIQVLRWQKDGRSLKEEAEKRGYRAEVQFADADQVLQNRQITSYISAGAKLLIVGSVNEMISPAIKAAAEANVPVIAYDRLIQDSDDYDYYITFNNFKVGVLMGEALVSAMGLDTVSPDAPKRIALFAGAPTDGNAFFFYDGAMSVLNPHIDSGALVVVGEYPRTSDDTENYIKIAAENWLGPPARERAERLLRNEAKDIVLDAILAPNDFIARNIMDIVRADPKYAEALPLITGQDAEFEAALAIKHGRQFCTIFKNTAKLAEAAVILADQILKGEELNVPGATLATGHLAKMGDTGKKIVKTYLLDPILITADNIHIPIDAGFYTAAESEELRK